MSISKLKGVLAPVLSAFNERAELDTPRSIAHCRWLLENGCNGLVIFGSTSEGNSLSVSERKQFLEDLLSSGVDPARLMPGTGCCSLADTAELSAHATALGCAGVLVLPPFYYKQITDDGLFRYYSLLIERVARENLRLYLYHIPPIAMVPLSLALVERLLTQFPGTLAGIKDSSGEWDNTRQLLRFAPNRLDVFVGNEKYLLQSLEQGGAGTISASANIVASTLQELYQTWRKPGAEALQQSIDGIRSASQSKPLIPGLKAILSIARGDASWSHVCPPFVELDALQREELFAALEASPFKWPTMH
jgi:4-hydroxy-tetrahydrodipicolinate synthase